MKISEELLKIIKEEISTSVFKVLKEESKRLLEENIQESLDKKWDEHVKSLSSNFKEETLAQWEYIISERAEYWDMWAKDWKESLKEGWKSLLTSYKSILDYHTNALNKLVTEKEKIEDALTRAQRILEAPEGKEE